MWFRRSEILVPLTNSHQARSSLNGFQPINRLLKRLRKLLELSYFYHTRISINLYFDASDHQLGAVIMQDKKPISCYSRKLNTAQRRYTTTICELLSDLFHNTWLAHYPCPQLIVFDNGGEFKREFKHMCDNYGIKGKPTTSHNPQQMKSLSMYTKL